MLKVEGSVTLSGLRAGIRSTGMKSVHDASNFACIVLLCTWICDIISYRMEEQGTAAGPVGSFKSVHAHNNVSESPVHDALLSMFYNKNEFYDARVLIDPRSTYSHMSYDFALHVHGKIEPLRYDVSVPISAGDITIVNIVIRACIAFCYVIVINLREFDVILGMDWSSKNHAITDFQINEVVMGIDGQLKTVLVGERKVVSSCLISAVIAFQLIKDGCGAYLANVKDTSKASPG